MIKTRQLFDQNTWTYTYLIFEVESKEAVIVERDAKDESASL